MSLLQLMSWHSSSNTYTSVSVQTKSVDQVRTDRDSGTEGVALLQLKSWHSLSNTFVSIQTKSEIAEQSMLHNSSSPVFCCLDRGSLPSCDTPCCRWGQLIRSLSLQDGLEGRDQVAWNWPGGSLDRRNDNNQACTLRVLLYDVVHICAASSCAP